MSFLPMTIAAGRVTRSSARPGFAGLGRSWKPALGLVFCRCSLRAHGNSRGAHGLSNGRLLPPPSVIFATFWELAQTGELQRHTLATRCVLLLALAWACWRALGLLLLFQF